MKRKGFKFLVLSSILALGVSSCTISPSGGGGDPSQDVEEQKKAIYQLAVQSGYQGTYEEWLESIRGTNGATILFGLSDPTVSQGNSGDAYLNTTSWDVFVKLGNVWNKVGNIMGPRGEQGLPGQDGVSVVSITLSASSGLVDTYEILYSNGNKSYFTVKNGEDGQSIQGEKGEDGHTPIITIVDGYWTIDGASTGIKATGEQGLPGVGIASIAYTSSDKNVDTYTITYTDGGTSTFTVTNGVDGSQGIQGEPGKDGHTPVITISNDGYWVVDGEKTTTLAQGPKGDQGEPGKDGVSITSIAKTGTDGNVDTYTITYSDGSKSYFTVTNGVNGSQGIQGEPGKDGHTPIITIVDGCWTIDGVSTGIKATGPQGPIGPQGPQGEQGQQGQTAWSNTILPSNNGYVIVDLGSALVGELVTFTAYPDYGYRVGTFTLNGVDVTEDFDFTTNSITVPMVEHGYVVRASFTWDEHTVSIYDYSGSTIVSWLSLPSGEYIGVQNLVKISDPAFVKPSDEKYDYILSGWTVNGLVYQDVDLHYGPIYEDLYIYPYYTAVEKTSIVEKYGVNHEGTYEDPFDNEDAIKVTRNLHSEDRNRTFYIRGVIDRYYNAPENRSDGQASFFLVPAEVGGEQFEIYRLRSEGYSFNDLYSGRELVVAGTLTMYGDQPETNTGATFVEFIGEANPPVMNNYQVSASEASDIALALADGDTTYDTYTVTGYVVARGNLNNYYTYFLADSLEGYTKVFAISPFYSIDGSIVDNYLGYGNLITFTDHLRNYHNNPVNNRYFVDESMFTLIEKGEGWPPLPNEIRFLDHDNYVDSVTMEPGQTLRLNYVLDQGSIEDVLIGASYFANVYFEDEQLVIELPYDFDIEAYKRRPYIRFASSEKSDIGMLYVDINNLPTQPITSLEFYYDKNVFVGASINLDTLPKNCYPSYGTIEDYIISSSNPEVAAFSGHTIQFLAVGEVDITVTETLSGVMTSMHFVVTINDLSELYQQLNEQFGPLPETEVFNNSAIIWLEEGATNYRALYKSMFDYLAKSYGSEEYKYGIKENSYVLTSDIILNENNYQILFVEGDDESNAITELGITTPSSEESSSFGPLYYPSFNSMPVVPEFNVGSTLYFMPYIYFEDMNFYGPIFKPYLYLESSNEEVAVVSHDNVVEVVGEGSSSITIYLKDGSFMSYLLKVEAPETLPEDAVLLDSSLNDFFTIAKGNVPTEYYYSPSENKMYMYYPNEGKIVNSYEIKERDDSLFIQFGSAENEGIYFVIDENNRILDPLLTALETASFTDSRGNNVVIDLGENGVAHVYVESMTLFGQLTFKDIHIYCGYVETSEGHYHVVTPFGDYNLKLIDGALVPVEFPEEEIAAALETIGAKVDSIPAFTGNLAKDYEVEVETNPLTPFIVIYISVEPGDEVAAVEQYRVELLNAGYTEAGVGEYGDTYYTSPNGELIVLPWAGNETDHEGYAVIEIIVNPAPEQVPEQ